MNEEGRENPPDDAVQRRDCLRKYKEEAVADDLPLEANAKLFNADLMLVADCVGRRIDASFEAGEPTDAVLPSIDTLVKLSRESEKWARFTTRHQRDDHEMLRRQFRK